jgi:hypothetical protein
LSIRAGKKVSPVSLNYRRDKNPELDSGAFIFLITIEEVIQGPEACKVCGGFTLQRSLQAEKVYFHLFNTCNQYSV